MILMYFLDLLSILHLTQTKRFFIALFGLFRNFTGLTAYIVEN
ncbi:hypothetical protein FHR92_003760 [Fontibacillus solani]|uniref:Uncharacterized protein n=1 Tax=Fontibacillus solani TaxID=1572857 RepID=A0A7W3XT56_9BACL|nr:hypothetical protein [Fontibacillus solani]